MTGASRQPGCGEGGFGTLPLVFMVLVAMMLTLGSLVLVNQSGQYAVLRKTQQDYLRQAAEAVKRFYQENRAQMDGAAAPGYTPVALLSGAGVQTRWNLQAAMSLRQSALSGAIQYRDIYLWIPRRNPDPTVLDAASDTFTPGTGVLWAKVSGIGIEKDAYQDAQTRLQMLAQALEKMFRAKLASDPLHDVSLNYFQAIGCSSHAAGEIPCTNNAYAAAASLGLGPTAGVGDDLVTDPWGGAVLASNTLDANQGSAPYSMALRVVTPWGSAITVDAVEPL